MKFGIFDYIDRRNEPLSQTYDERMALIRAAEAAGFYGYHVTEHHVTPLSATPSPSVYLAAVARETTRIRIGALLFLLPLYHPLRLIEELCMLDNLSGGRLDIGVGRGIAPPEFEAYGAQIEDSQEVFDEVFEILCKGFSEERLNHHGKRFRFDHVPMVMRPAQRPHPPFWLGVRSEHGIAFAAARGMNIVTLGSNERVAAQLAAFREAWRTRSEERRDYRSPVEAPLMGAVRALFIADSDAEAERLARPAYQQWFDSLAWLWRDKGTSPPIALSQDFAAARQAGSLVVGRPDTVRKQLMAQAQSCGYNYLVLQLAFGSLTHAQEMHSLKLFHAEVMPALAEIAEAEPVRP